MKRKVFGALVCTLIGFVGVQTAHAFTLMSGKYSNGAFTFKDNSLKTTIYVSTARAAMISWANNDPDVSFTFNSSDFEIEVVGASYGNTDWNAWTTNYWNFWQTYYSDSLIEANYTYMDSMSNNQKQGVFAHELGHALGLNHVTDKYQVMCTELGGRSVYLPGSDDIKGLNYLY